MRLESETPLDPPVEVTIRFRTSQGGLAGFELLPAGGGPAALSLRVRPRGPNELQVHTAADGRPMATEIASTRRYDSYDEPRGTFIYRWRYVRVSNTWDDRDRAEIGSMLDRLVPFDDRVFTARLVATATGRQIWLDDRLVAEHRGPSAGSLRLAVDLAGPASVVAVDTQVPRATPGHVPLKLGDYRHDAAAVAAGSLRELPGGRRGAVPFWLPEPGQAGPDIDLGESLFRYRGSVKSGPDTGWVRANATYPSTFAVDAAQLAFRIPYRDYRAAWLVAWVDEESGAVPRGCLRLFREDGGYPAETEFAVDEAAIASGLVRPLDATTPAGRPLYLVRVPLDADGLAGMRDLADQFLSFELSKPVRPMRGYPDPIYYGSHAAGPPSSLHVAAITFEEAAFGFEIVPERFAHVFERPERPAYTVRVVSHDDRPRTVDVRLATRSYAGDERREAVGRVDLPARGTGETRLELGLDRLGWHAVTATVGTGDEVVEVGTSLVLLPPDTRTTGTAANETRFGAWVCGGHYLPWKHGDTAANEPILALYRRLGLRLVNANPACVDAEAARRQGLLPRAGHTAISFLKRTALDDPQAFAAAVAVEVAAVRTHAEKFSTATYFYGGEWGPSAEAVHGAHPRYTGDGPRRPSAEELDATAKHMKIFTAIGSALRESGLPVKLYLQWGGPKGTIPYLEQGFPRELVDGYGMDAPMFETLPEVPVALGCINETLWTLRQEVARLGYPQLPVHWCEGPFLNTNPHGLSLEDQAAHQVRYILAGLAHGMGSFQSAVVDFDAGNYYGAEHYGLGLFRRVPLVDPKPSVAAFATASRLLCGRDPAGHVDTGSLTTFCQAFRHAGSGAMTYALWRVRGTAEARLRVEGTGPLELTDMMGNSRELPVTAGVATVRLSPEPVWVSGAATVAEVELGAPEYADAPAPISRPLVRFTADNWQYDGGPDASYADNHYGVRRVTDPQLAAAFDPSDASHGGAVAVTLPEQPGDRPLAIRYGRIVLREPAEIPGKAAAVGLWVRGNASWGRVAWRLVDAEGERWTSIGGRNSYNCDDTHGWSRICFEGWRYVRFPLPANAPGDGFRELDSTWWKYEGGDGEVDFPLRLETVFVEALNEVVHHGRMRVVSDRTYLLGDMVVEYADEADARPDAARLANERRPVPLWRGPTDNPIARLAERGAGTSPPIRACEEPKHFADGRRMHVRFAQEPGWKYDVYLARSADGSGAELFRANVSDGQAVAGFRPGLEVFLFLAATSPDGGASKPSPPFRLVTEDRFAEK